MVTSQREEKKTIPHGSLFCILNVNDLKSFWLQHTDLHSQIGFCLDLAPCRYLDIENFSHTLEI